MKNENNMIKDAQLASNFSWLYEKKIVIYGAGKRGGEAFEILSNLTGADIIAYCETDLEEWKRRNKTRTKNGIIVKSIKDVAKADESNDTLILIAIKAMREEQKVIELLEENYSGQFNYVVTWTAFILTVYLNIRDNRFNERYKLWFEERNFLRVNKLMAEFIDNSFEDAMNKEAVIVYQPGKVGSFSVYKSLDRNNIPCAHIHRIADMDNYNAEYYEKYSRLGQIWRSMTQDKECTKIITLVRDPIMRSISGFFQGIYQDCICDVKTGMSIEENIIQYIEKDVNYGGDGYMFEWFRGELEKMTGVNIYKYKFNKDKGYCIVKEGKFEVLCLTMEKMKQNEEVVRAFIGADGNFQILNENVGNYKNYRYLYDFYKKNLRFPQNVLDFYYKNNKSMNYFYTLEDVEDFRAKHKRISGFRG